MEGLTERQRAILKTVVQDYIATAVPVSSKAVAERLGDVSSATVRNEMALLEELGYLAHPHTSAGRVPTDQGYRCFVEHLMDEAELSLEEQRTIRHQFHQATLAMEQWLKLAAAVLAHNAASASLVTAPRAARCRLKHIELIAISEATVLLIIVLQDGTVRQQLLIPPQQMSQDELSLIANRMTAEWGSLSAMELRATRGPLSPIESYIADNIITLMQRVGQEGGREVYRNGLVHVLSEPEFVHREAMRHVIEVLEYGSVLEEILDRVMASRGVQVIIGGEGRWNEIDECSLVMASYGVNDEAAGALGVWGPRRMSYSRAVSTVRYVAGLMSDLVQKLYGIPYPIE